MIRCRGGSCPDLHAGVQDVDAFQQALATDFVGFTVVGPEQEIPAMKKRVGFLFDIDQFPANAAAAELGHRSVGGYIAPP